MGKIPSSVLLKYYIKLLNFSLIKQVTRSIYLKSLESVSLPTAANGLQHVIRAGNIVALDVADPQISVRHDYRADI